MKLKPDDNIYLIALGSNMGDRRKYIKRACELLDQHTQCRLIKTADILETTPIGEADQLFLNSACLIESTLSPQDMMKLLLQTEEQLGRVRTIKWGNRQIDLDIILMKTANGEFPIISETNVEIPHPEFHKRDFVLIPCADIAAEWVDPHSDKKIAEILKFLRNEKTGV